MAYIPVSYNKTYNLIDLGDGTYDSYSYRIFILSIH